MSGLLNSFNIAKRGMQAQQTALSVTSHNVANANTEGYSVQRAEFKTTRPFGMPSINMPGGAGQIGTGVDVTSITRSRDEFLDIQIRKETSTLNRYTSREEFLTAIESMYTEPSDTGISKMLSNFWDSWSGLATTPQSPTSKELAKSNGEALAQSIRHLYSQLEDLEGNVADQINQQIFDTDSILTQITDLNQQIKAVVIGGKVPNDLLDRRDLLVDNLSQRLNVEVEKTDFGGIKLKTRLSDGSYVDILSDSSLKNGFAFVNDIEFKVGADTIQKKDFPKTFSNADLPTSIDLKLYINGDINKPKTVSIEIKDLNDLKKYFDIEEVGNDDFKIKTIMPHTVFYDKASYDNGTLDNNGITPGSITNGSLKGLDSLSYEINDYKNQLNRLAKTIAISVNTIHSNSTDIDDGVNFFNKAAETSDQAAKIIDLDDAIKNDYSKINAGKFLNDSTGFVSGNGERALLLSQLRNTRITMLDINNREEFVSNVFQSSTGSPITTTSPNGINLVDKSEAKMISNNSGTTIDNYFKATIAQLGVSNQEARKMVENQQALLDQLVVRRESISGVSIDEEVTNMLQFQRAYQANARMINVIDELLDVVVNGLIRR